MKLEGPFCCLNSQLTTTVRAMGVCWTRAASVARVGGDAEAQPVATTLSRIATSTATRFMVSSLANGRLLHRRDSEGMVAFSCLLVAPDVGGGLDDEAEL